MKIINAFLDVVLKTIMVLSAASVLIVSTLQIVSRFVTQLPIGWSMDVLRMSFIYAVFSGAAYCAKNNDHINLDIVLSFMSKRTRNMVETGILLAVMIFCAVVATVGYRYSLTGLNQNAPFIPIKMTYMYAAVPVSFAIMTFYYLLQVISRVKIILAPEETTES